MKKGLLDAIICPGCGSSAFELHVDAEDRVEIRKGSIICRDCSRTFPVSMGIPDLLLESNDIIVREQKGWERLKQAVENTDELMLSLPDASGEHRACWKGQADNFHHIFSGLDLSGREKVLDMGAGRCWSTRFFSRKGCWSAAADILLPRYIGLETADIYIAKEDTYFERIRSSMDSLPFKDSVFDIVFMAAALHHSPDIQKPLREAFRVLRDNGRLVLVNETVKGFLKINDRHNPELEAGINENPYFLSEYLNRIKKAGFVPDIQFWLGGHNRVSNLMDSVLKKFFPESIINRYIWKPLKFIQLFLLGGVLNLVAKKRTVSY